MQIFRTNVCHEYLCRIFGLIVYTDATTDVYVNHLCERSLSFTHSLVQIMSYLVKSLASVATVRKLHANYINYSLNNQITYFVINVSTSRRKSSSGLTSGSGRQCVRICPIRGSIGSSPRLDSCCWSS